MRRDRPTEHIAGAVVPRPPQVHGQGQQRGQGLRQVRPHREAAQRSHEDSASQRLPLPSKSRKCVSGHAPSRLAGFGACVCGRPLMRECFCMIGRIVIDDVRPRTPAGYPAKAVVGDEALVSADIFRDGHDVLAARVCWRAQGERKWRDAPMVDAGNDRWTATIVPEALGDHTFTIEAWTDRPATWWHDVTVKHADGPGGRARAGRGRPAARGRGHAPVPRSEGATVLALAAVLRDATLSPAERLEAVAAAGVIERLSIVPDPTDLTASPAMPLWVDRPACCVRRVVRAVPALGGRPRRHPPPPARHRGDGVRRRVPPADPSRSGARSARVATTRSSRPTTIPAAHGRSAARWAVTPPCIPTSARSTDLDALVAETERLGMEIALDYALQCSPDHPWVREHPEWFHHRPDGSIRYAENPPKKYQDIYPINFWPAERRRSARAVGGVPRHLRALDRSRHPHLPRRQPAHEAAGVLGVGHRRHPRPPSRGAVPGRGVHPPEDDGEAGRDRVHARATRTSRGAPRATSCGRTSPSSRRARWPTTCARTSGPTRPTSSPVRCATARPRRSRCGSCSRPRSCRATASTAGTSWARTSRRASRTRSTPARRSTRSSGATGRSQDWCRSSRGSTRSAAPTRASPGSPTSASTTPTTRRSSPTAGAGATTPCSSS